ncbi:response regulator [Candidatus Binatia bacterium]|nr:response regulator [Candidatus Binatia bacterium]
MSDKILLLAEDNPDDADLTIRALKRHNILNQVVLARDGSEALDYLFGTGAYAGRDTSVQPALVLLDLNLPKVGGMEVLRRLRADRRTAFVPVVILTSSKEDQDILDAYRSRVNSYIRKPVDFAEFAEAARVLGLYWLLLNETAGSGGGGESI